MPMADILSHPPNSVFLLIDMVRQKVVLISILLIVVIAMVYLSVEGFYVFLTNRELLQSKLGILPGMNTASMPAEELERRMEWMADNAPSGSQKNLYDSIRNSGNLNEIQKLMKRWKEEWDQTDVHDKPMITTYNKLRHQFKDSECGMYCLYFHYCCLNEIPMDIKIPDDAMNVFRKLLFKED